MPWKMNCLLCKPGTDWHPPRPRCATQDLVALQEHIMEAHDYYQDAFRSQKRLELSPDFYRWTIDDVEIMEAWRDLLKITLKLGSTSWHEVQEAAEACYRDGLTAQNGHGKVFQLIGFEDACDAQFMVYSDIDRRIAILKQRAANGNQ